MVRELLKEPISDGGQWHMLQNLVAKYGVVPKHCMGESKGLSPAAFSRQKGLLRRLKAMSDPTGPMPEGLPVDYKPFESVA